MVKFAHKSLLTGMSTVGVVATVLTDPFASQAQPSNTEAGYGARGYDSTQTGIYNTAIGFFAISQNISGSYNSAIGTEALSGNNAGSYNAVNGTKALFYNYNGAYNSATGFETPYSNYDGNYNTANGAYALYNNYESKSVANGSGSRQYVATGSHNVDLGNGEMGTDSGIEDGTHPIQYGPIAEEVARVYPDLVQYDEQGKPFTVYYDLLTPMMLNDLQKAYRQIAVQKSEFTTIQATVQNQSTALTSLQNTVQILLMVVCTFVLAAVAAAAHALSANVCPVPNHQAQPVAMCAV